MEKIPKGRYRIDFREEDTLLVIEDRMAAEEVAGRLSLPKST